MLRDARSSRCESEIVEAIFTAWHGTAPVSAPRVLQGGIGNEAYEVTTASDSFVMRLQFDTDVVDVFLKERVASEMARAAGVTTPAILAAGMHAGHSYQIQEKLPGVNGDAYEGDPLPIWEALGRIARQVNSVRTYGFGEHLREPAGEGVDVSIHGWVDASLDYYQPVDELIRAGAFTGGARLRRALDRVESLRSWSCDPHLTHGDMTPRNLLIGSRGEIAVIDWGDAVGHRAPIADLAELLAWATPEPEVTAWRRGYGISDREVREWSDALESYQVARMMMAAAWSIKTGRGQGQMPFVCYRLNALVPA